MARFASHEPRAFTVFAPVPGMLQINGTDELGNRVPKTCEGVVGLKVAGLVAATSAKAAIEAARSPLNPAPMVVEGFAQ